MKKNITILSLLIGIYLMVPLVSFGQTTEQNQNIACNNLPNGSSCKYKVQLSGRDPENEDIEGRCDRRGDGILYCNNTLTGWEDCFDRSQPNDACKDKASGKIGACVQQGTGSNFTCNTDQTPTFNPEQSTVNPSNTLNQNTTSSATTTAGTVSYQSYTNFPGVGRISNLCQLMTGLWYLGFAVLLTSVLGMFLYGGYIYVTAGVNSGKVNQAKEIFTNTITGLIIGLSIFIIINIINPGLLQGNCSIPSVGSGSTIGGPGEPSNIVPKPGESVFPVTYLYQGPSGGQLYGAPREYGPHTGIDFTPCWADVVPGGVPFNRQGWGSQPILAFRDGTVIKINERGLNDVRIRHKDGVETRYTHNSVVSVSVGQEVKAGQEIAKLGEKGSEGVPHLHFDVFINGSTVNPYDILLDSSRNPDPSKVKTTGSPKSGCGGL